MSTSEKHSKPVVIYGDSIEDADWLRSIRKLRRRRKDVPEAMDSREFTNDHQITDGWRGEG